MKAIAEFAMRGRFQALLLTVGGAGSILFCWISAAVLALVTLRKGAGMGAQLWFWALLPSGAVWYTSGDSGPLTLLTGTLVLAMVLRATVSLPLAVLASVAIGALSGLAMLTLGQHYLDQMVSVFGEFLAQLEQNLAQGGEAVQLPRPTNLQIAGMLGAGTAMTSVLCLLLARYWQAALYNPGGFGDEFRALRFTPAVATGMALAAAAVSALGAEFRTWAVICMLPLSFAGLALVHARARYRGQGTGWLVAFYAIWIIFDPIKLMVVFVAIADSWFDFRQRWAKPGKDLDRGED
ncbi:hypothetical protein BST95_00175 [Halioglobus japonicus]|uniref:DUF2232 domain-containing protein n=1 Tax=Halioglobus japonicus TaxID=930805 RepID=A0AAP8SLP3_9GAMM|nr:hypothetical protein [Halioglobus japonicus]AQA16869.1 hypothetical protein BST95_00175 [Halioglobus japonicus]PLW84752.1 hypothetical protein C0029_17270 [Halioglobus japonicus]GHD21235.1 hypothetical protein GCM10007052_31790 [Halioglobus japonicus]